MKRLKKYFSLLLILAIALGMLVGCGSEENSFKEMKDFEQAKVGVLTGSSFDLLAGEYFPEAEKLYYMNITDLILNLNQKKIDGILMDMGFFTPLMWENEGISCVEMEMPATEYAVAFPKSEQSELLKTQIDEFIETHTRDGWLDELSKKWFSASEPDGSLDMSILTGENGTLRVATTLESKPFDYLKEGQHCGFDADFIFRFAMEYGYALEIDTMDFGALLPSISAGRYDLAIASITITEERKESVLFSDVYCKSPIVMAVTGGEAAAGTIKTLSDLETGTIGIVTGTNWDVVAQNKFPNAERKYFSSSADVLLALEQGKVDAYFADKVVYAGMRWENPAISCIDESVEDISNALIFAKEGYNEVLLAEINEFIAEAKDNGILDRLAEKWFGNTEPEEHPDYTKLTGEKGTIRVAIGDAMKPTAYQKGSMYTGYEVDFLMLFAEEYGYKLELQGMNFDALIPSVSSGKCDIGACGITITSERKESVTFSDPHFETYGVAVVRSENAEGGQSVLEGIKEDFAKTFIRESRWKLIVKGIGVTVLISICAAIAGSVLGFGLYMLSRSDISFIRKLANGFAKVYTRIIAGTPVVVILMILFYVIFGRFRDMSGVLVAIIGFTLTFGAFVYDHMTVSVGSVDRGQTEAAYALGYAKNKTFFRIIFPQTMNIFLPSYCGQAVELVKATAVVGYVAVNDLTKMGDIIRSNTYEAFFPLISTAVIYFLLTWILSLLLGLVKLRFEPKRRSKDDILKGVKTI